MLSSLQEKIKYSKKGFCCLVVTSVLEPSKVKGAVEISLQGEKVHLLPAEADMSATYCHACMNHDCAAESASALQLCAQSACSLSPLTCIAV